MKKNALIVLVLCAVSVVVVIIFVINQKSRSTEVPSPTQPISSEKTITSKPESTLPLVQTPNYGFDNPQWWNHAVFYEIFVRSFYDSNGDGIGDFNGITEKLDYLNDGNPDTSTDLGINAIWLMPIFPSPSYHGYDVLDYLTVNSEYGTKEDFQRMITEAHKRGIHVIIDFVINHTSDQNPWFIASEDPVSKYHDWYVWSQTDPGYLGPWNEKVWHLDGNGEYYYGVFSDHMPDLNFTNQSVTDEIETVAKYWLTEMAVDGFRIDGARHLLEDGATQVNTPETKTWFQNFQKFLKDQKPSAMSIGEVWDSSYVTIKYIQSNDFDLVFDFDLSSAIITNIGRGDGNSLSSTIGSEVDLYKNKGMGTFLTNHDMNRVMSQLGNDSQRAKNAATVLLTAPGTPFIYYGEEIGALGEKPDEQIRTPMQWGPKANAEFTTGIPWEAPNSSYLSANVLNESKDDQSLLSTYRNLIQLRMSNAALLEGNYTPINSSDSEIYAALRQSVDETILVIVNLKGKTAENVIFSLPSGILLDGNKLVSLLGGSDFDAQLTTTEVNGKTTFSLNKDIPADSNLVYLVKK
ncbi:MAG: alpha-amylase family glycosyl hydrolase [Anaerolineaceae bacterium]